MKYKKKEVIKRDITEPMTWPVFADFKASNKGGGYQPDQIKGLWQDLQKPDSGAEQDRFGVIGGVGGQLRIWAVVGQKKLADDVSG
eukprot:4501919-Alexandrium_andersonii.AAC.1